MLVSKYLRSQLHESLNILKWNSPLISLSLHLMDGVITNGRNIRNFVKSQPLFDVYRQYL